MTTLIFPALNQLALDYLHDARNRGESVLAASSVYDARMESEFGRLTVVPYVYDANFRDVFLDLVRGHGVTRVYSPVASVHAFLESFISAERLSLELVGRSPIRQQVEGYTRLRRKVESLLPFIEACSATKDETVSRLDVEAMFRYADGVYGESNDEKLAAMMAIFESAPNGDVVEIGSLMGKSAFVLTYLARHYDTGNVLSIDPLSPQTSMQREFPAAVQNAMDNQWDYAVLREAFVVNLLPVASGRFNYLRMTSERGFERYCAERSVASPEFGTVSYTGSITVLHIDGNHDFAHAHQDCDLWLRRVAPGAWLILDDYLWPHGDGPYRVGNTLLEERGNDIERAFVCGKALFVKFVGKDNQV